MNLYPIYCQKCNKILGVTAGNSKIQCPVCGGWVVIEKNGDNWTTRREATQ